MQSTGPHPVSISVRWMAEPISHKQRPSSEITFEGQASGTGTRLQAPWRSPFRSVLHAS